MSNVMTVLKAEITRLARKEAKAAVTPIRKPGVAVRKAVADLKQRVAGLEKECKRLGAELARIPPPAPQEVPGKGKGWISGKGVRSLRQKLGLSQDAFARLVGVTPNGVYQWERKAGMLRLRDKTRTALLAARNLGAREAKARLAEMALVKKVTAAGKPSRQKGRK